MNNLKNLTENQINNLKELSKFCYTNEEDFRVRVSLRLIGRIQDIALNIRWDDRASVTEYKEYASKLIRLWFPQFTEERILEEVNNIRWYNTMNMNKLVKEMLYINKILN